MLSYAARRLLGAIPTLFIVITLTFFMMRAAPGGPFDSQRRLPPEIEHNINAVYNLDKPLIVQYGLYLDRLAHFDLGPSFKNRDFTVTRTDRAGLAGERAAGHHRHGDCSDLWRDARRACRAETEQGRGFRRDDALRWWASPFPPSSPRRC